MNDEEAMGFIPHSFFFHVQCKKILILNGQESWKNDTI